MKIMIFQIAISFELWKVTFPSHWVMEECNDLPGIHHLEFRSLGFDMFDLLEACFLELTIELKPMAFDLF